MTAGLIFDIQRFSIHDGPGIRTTVFMKGCPLSCLWCHNPESQAAKPELFFSPEKCIGCGNCVEACARGCHRFEDDIHVLDRDRCVCCGDCRLDCYAQALELVGKTMTVEEVLAEVLKDRPFYTKSGGGVTLSGGEPMQQFEFARALLVAAKRAGLSTCIETSGMSTAERFVALIPSVDLFLYDIKETDPEVHRQCTGAENRAIVENLRSLDRAGALLILRCPIIPGLNDRDTHFQQIAELAGSLTHVKEIHVLPYHALGTAKSRRLGKMPPLAETPMPDELQTRQWISSIQAHTGLPVRKG
jgi:pyruvate formate lyase activating enzyme